jgi:hypothetical protein
MEQPIPEIIRLISDFDIPDSIQLVATDIPKTIELVPRDIPEAIRLVVPSDFPSTIRLDASGIPETIKVTGIPDTIEIKHNIPEEIFLKAPDGFEIPIASYKGAPLPVDVRVKIDLNTQRADIPSDQLQCVAIVPCPNP